MLFDRQLAIPVELIYRDSYRIKRSMLLRSMFLRIRTITTVLFMPADIALTEGPILSGQF